jgi:hypothetical protein
MKETCGRFKNASGRLFARPLFPLDGRGECQSDLTSLALGLREFQLLELEVYGQLHSQPA